MSYPLLQFVASPDTGAAVRFDFNTGTTGVDGSTEVLQDGFSLGSPTLQGDPDGIGSEYGFRELSIPLRINGTTTSAPAKMATLAKELGRETNWLRFQSTATSTPYWFKTYRSAPEPLDWEQFRNLPDATVAKWYVPLKLDADSFACGAKQTIGPVTIGNNPASGTNRCSYVLPTIVGDAPASLAFWVLPSAKTKARMMLSCIGLDGYAAPYVWQSSAFTAGTDTSAETANAAFSGGGYRSVSFATVATMAARLTGNLPTNPPPGRYKVLARVARSDTSSVFDVKFASGYAAEGVNYEGPTVRVSGTANAATWATVLDLGEFDFPAGTVQGTILDTSNYGGVPVQLSAARVSGTGALQIDYLMAVPVQVGSAAAGTIVMDDLSLSNIGVDVGLNTVYYGDGEAEVVKLAFLSGTALSMVHGGLPVVNGDFPKVTPGVSNVVHLVQHVEAGFRYFGISNSGTNADVIAATTDLFLVYRPRWLYLGAA